MLSRFEHFTYDINEIDLHWHRIAAAGMKQYGLRGGTSIYLTKLCSAPDGMSASELAAACGRDKADVSRDLRQLERAGIISRGKGYRACVTLTQQGQELAEQIIRKAEYAVGFVGGSLNEREREIFYSVLDRITENMRRLSEIGLDN